MKNLPNTPSLRFPQFSGNWEIKKLGEIAEFLDDKRIPLSETERNGKQGQFRYYGASGIIDFVDNYIFEGEYVLLGEDGANIINRNTKLAFVVNGKFWVNNHAHVLKAKGSNIFLAESLERINYEPFNTGTAQPKLNASVCKQIEISFPTLPEQEKIAGFLTVVDEKLQALKKKKALLEDYKKGIMQRIFSGQLRFKDAHGQSYPDWEVRKLGEVAEIKMGQSPDSKSYNDTHEGIPLIQGNADIVNRISQPRNWTTEITKTCNIGDLILTVRAPVGSIAKSNHYACIGRGVASIKNNSNSNQEYLYQFLINFEKNWKGIEQGSTFTSVSGLEIKNIEINLPSLPEQEKIAEFLGAIDAKIAALQTQLDKTREWKKGLLQGMFC